jgi:AraC-like DNA-binding protein
MKRWVLFYVFFMLAGISMYGNDWQAVFRHRLYQLECPGFFELEAYLDSVLNADSAPDSAQVYFGWFRDHRTEVLAGNCPTLNAACLVESARISHYQGASDTACQDVGLAIAELEHAPVPSVRVKILELGRRYAVDDGNYLQAIHFLRQIEQMNYYPLDSKVLSDILLDVADYYRAMHKYDHSMDYCRKVFPLLIHQKYGKGKVRALLTMYDNAHFTASDTTSTEYLYQALEIARGLNDSVLLASVYEYLGLSYYRNSDQQEAIRHYKKSRQFQHETGSPADLYTALNLQLSYTLADSVEAVGKLSEFIVKQSEKNGYVKYLSNAYRGRAWFFAKTGRRDSAVFYLDAAFENRQSLPEKKDASPGFYYYLYEVADILNDKDRALKFLSLAHSQYVFAQRELNADHLHEIRANFDYQVQREKIERLTLQNKLENEINARQKILLIAFMVVFMTGLIFWIFAREKYNQLRKSHQALFKKNLELDRLYTRLSKTEQNLGNSKNGNGIKNEEEIYRKLKDLLEKDEIFKQTDLSVNKLARKLKTNTSYLSAIINSRFEESFKTVINKYRIAEARRLLASPGYANFSIEGIAEEVGFHSRSAFYQSFRQVTGLTPSQYMNNLKSYPKEDEE